MRRFAAAFVVGIIGAVAAGWACYALSPSGRISPVDGHVAGIIGTLSFVTASAFFAWRAARKAEAERLPIARVQARRADRAPS